MICLDAWILMFLNNLWFICSDGMLMLPSSYQHILRLFSQTLPGKSRGQLLKLLEDFKLARYQSLGLLHDRLEVGTETGWVYVHGVLGCGGLVGPCEVLQVELKTSCLDYDVGFVYWFVCCLSVSHIPTWHGITFGSSHRQVWVNLHIQLTNQLLTCNY